MIGGSRDLALWGGVECSVVRVGDRTVDQLDLTGHSRRAGDLEELAALGVRVLRYPVSWERVWPDPDRAPDWSFFDARLQRLQALGIRPIVGLVHHGSGPRHTNLLEESFVTGLADFAVRVAERYPWVTDFVPVNEPLTTARFSALYGHWYPHARSGPAFVRALLVQCRAIRAAMRSIRRVRPEARLVVTEDLGTVFATHRLAYQAAFENERRWASLDLLTGRMGPEHPLRRHLVENGAPEEILDSFTRDPCAPDLLGMNHYVTSDRFLDERLERYPVHTHGGNGIDAYADLEAVRVCDAHRPGHRALLEQLWARYRLPLAITEAHLGCAPEEQIRWLHEAWTAAHEARRAGADVRAVTAWAAFGASDWDSLLTEPRNHYEPGIFDVRGDILRPTALAQVVADLIARGTSDHPLLCEPGWWRRHERLLYPSTPPLGCTVGPAAMPARRPLLVTGARGTLGRAVARVARARGLVVLTATRAELDVGDRDEVAALLDAHRPWAVVNAAGYVRVDDAEHDAPACMRANRAGAAVLARACEARGIRLATFSSDLVFDGAKGAPYVERDEPCPLNVYGVSKASAERLVADLHPGALVIRTAAFFGPWSDHDFVQDALADLRAGHRVRAAFDVVVSPTYVPDLAAAIVTLLVDGARGLWHLATPGAMSWFELARRAAQLTGTPFDTLVSCDGASLGLPARRPSYTALASERGALLPPLDEALATFVREWRARATR